MRKRTGSNYPNSQPTALKHHTSKLSTFKDLSDLQTYGFRGEALSSLCALSNFRLTTAQANQAPKATRLDFEPSGKLKGQQVVAGQCGTTASVEGLFKKLPVRRRELEKNIKREYGKVLNLLHAYACVCTRVRFCVKNSVGKNRNVVVFATNGNQTTKENIANVYGAKTLAALIPLDLSLDFGNEFSSSSSRRPAGAAEGEDDKSGSKIFVRGHISKPVFGEGRQTPDRQMFFVNSRPCGLPQIAKAFNEVYRSFNVSQSPFIFADFHMDTNAYDVNVSPDKRTILLHDAGALIESLKISLTRLFESSDQTVPQSQALGSNQPAIRQHLRKASQVTVDSSRKSSGLSTDTRAEEDRDPPSDEEEASQPHARSRLGSFVSGHTSGREAPSSAPGSVPTHDEPVSSSPVPDTAPETVESTRRDDLNSGPDHETDRDEHGPADHVAITTIEPSNDTPPSSSQQAHSAESDELAERPSTIQNAFDRMRPKRTPAELATITVGNNKAVASIVGSGVPKKRSAEPTNSADSGSRQSKRRVYTPSRPNIFSRHMKAFAAPGSQVAETSADGAEEDMDDTEDRRSDGDSASQSSSDAQSNPEQDDAANEDQPGEAREDDMEANNHRGSSVAPDKDEIDDEKKKAEEEARVEQLIQNAEQGAALPEGNSVNRANKLKKGGAGHGHSTVHLVGAVDGSLARIQSQLDKLQHNLQLPVLDTMEDKDEAEGQELSEKTAEDRLSLTVTKEDFEKMRIIGQFNLGFILATRPSKQHLPTGSYETNDGGDDNDSDELFIIDQHASDEKYNFERLQAETVVQNQRLVQPKTLDLTAIEEEIVLENQTALEKNGFVVEIDDSGNEPIGRRCKLLSLPLSKEVVFGVRDLEELIVQLSESPSASQSASDAHIPRPSKVRKMFAMRACRSSIMVGKNLTQRQMERVVRNMGMIDKPWNCPHGRPTMRHLTSLGAWSEYDEWDEVGGDDGLDAWRSYLGGSESGEEEEEEDSNEEGE